MTGIRAFILLIVYNRAFGDSGASNIEYIDLNPALLDAKGETRGELFRPDSLHYVPSTYELFASVIKPVLQRAWAAR